VAFELYSLKSLLPQRRNGTTNFFESGFNFAPLRRCGRNSFVHNNYLRLLPGDAMFGALTFKTPRASL
jgi:hypothetical protein